MSVIGQLVAKETRMYTDSMAALEKLRHYADSDSVFQKAITEKENELESLKESVDGSLRRALLDYSIPIRQAFAAEGIVTIQTCAGFDLDRLRRMLPYFHDWEKEGKYKVHIDYDGDDSEQGNYLKVMVTPIANLKDNKIPNDMFELAKLEKDSIVAKGNGELQFPERSLDTRDGKSMIDALAVQLFSLKDVDRLDISVMDDLSNMFKVFK